VQEGTVDYELLEIRSEHLLFMNVPSLLQDKYVYGHGEEFLTVCFYLFSTQSMLWHTVEAKGEHESFFDLVRACLKSP